MNKGFRLFQGDAVGFLNSDDTFHDSRALSDIAAAMQDSDIVYGDLNMVTDHRTKRVARAWRGGAFNRYSFQLGWVPPHPTFYMRREVAEKVGDYDLSYITTADYDYMLRALALNDFRVRYIPRVIADFQMGGISTRGWRVTLRGNLECLRSRRVHLNAPDHRRRVFPAFRQADFSDPEIRTVRASWKTRPLRPMRRTRIRGRHPSGRP